MRRMMMVSLIVLTIFSVGACSQEPAPVMPDKPVAADKPQPVVEDLKPVTVEVQQQVEAGIEVLKQEATTQTEAAGQQAAAAVAQEKTALAEMAAPDAKPIITGPEMVRYEASKGTVLFNHAAHAGRFACSECHSTDPPQKISIDKTSGHALCKGCHQQNDGPAPKTCTGCHQS